MDNRFSEISFFDLMSALWRRKWWIVLISVLFGGMVFAYTKFMVPKSYTSTSRLYVVNKTEDGIVSNQDLQAGSALTKDYREIILTDDTVDATISDLGLDLTPSQFLSKVEVTTPADTRIIMISATDTNPEEAARIANELRVKSASKIIDVTQVTDVTTLQEARVPKNPSGPNTVKRTLLGILLGGFGTVFVILSKEILDNRVKRPEDLEKLELTHLGSIPAVKSIK